MYPTLILSSHSEAQEPCQSGSHTTELVLVLTWCLRCIIWASSHREFCPVLTTLSCFFFNHGHELVCRSRHTSTFSTYRAGGCTLSLEYLIQHRNSTGDITWLRQHSANTRHKIPLSLSSPPKCSNSPSRKTQTDPCPTSLATNAVHPTVRWSD